MNIEEARKEPTSRQGLHLGTWIFILGPGLIMCLYLGWVYQASWYWYYGIDPIQLNLPITTIIQQSLALSLLSLSLLLIIYGVIFYCV